MICFEKGRVTLNLISRHVLRHVRQDQQAACWLAAALSSSSAAVQPKQQQQVQVLGITEYECLFLLIIS